MKSKISCSVSRLLHVSRCAIFRAAVVCGQERQLLGNPPPTHAYSGGVPRGPHSLSKLGFTNAVATALAVRVMRPLSSHRELGRPRTPAHTCCSRPCHCPRRIVSFPPPSPSFLWSAPCVKVHASETTFCAGSASPFEVEIIAGNGRGGRKRGARGLRGRWKRSMEEEMGGEHKPLLAPHRAPLA